MPFIIDGHNLIPRIPHLKLSDLDDEIKLIRILQRYGNQRRSRIEVYFDKAPVSKARVEEHGKVQAHFVHQGSTADQAIKSRIKELGKRAKNWTVVSSDRDILAEARSYQCRIINSSDFAGDLLQEPNPQPIEGEKDLDPEVSSQDVDYWLDQFSEE
jgi:predicted RNA-binding protein with PIN domain